ncbi:type II secretion system protein [bacterium]|nr:type II secretion system protein [bacterium]
MKFEIEKVFGFTMAEVLVTLGLVGVVAAMTLSMLMPRLERIRNAAILKRAYSDIAKYIDMFSYKYDCYDKLTFCSPAYEFKKDFAKYLVEEQGFVNICPDKGWPGWIYYLPYGEAKNTSLGQCRKHDLSYGPSYIRSRNGYALYITDFMSDDYYRIGKDTFRLKISIVTDVNKTTRINNIQWDNANDCIKDYKIIYPQQGKNMFDVYVMNSKRVLPAGSPLCKGSRDSWTYYCTGDLENGCSKEKQNFTQCTQKVIDDGWKILYEY